MPLARRRCALHRPVTARQTATCARAATQGGRRWGRAGVRRRSVECATVAANGDRVTTATGCRGAATPAVPCFAVCSMCAPLRSICRPPSLILLLARARTCMRSSAPRPRPARARPFLVTVPPSLQGAALRGRAVGGLQRQP